MQARDERAGLPTNQNLAHSPLIVKWPERARLRHESYPAVFLGALRKGRPQPWFPLWPRLGL
jgi:hypothetical protein